MRASTANPRHPVPRSILIAIVSATSSAWCAVTSTAPNFCACVSKKSYRFWRANSSLAFGPRLSAVETNGKLYFCASAATNRASAREASPRIPCSTCATISRCFDWLSISNKHTLSTPPETATRYVILLFIIIHQDASINWYYMQWYIFINSAYCQTESWCEPPRY